MNLVRTTRFASVILWASLIVGLTLATGELFAQATDPETTPAPSTTVDSEAPAEPTDGAPPLDLDLGEEDDAPEQIVNINWLEKMAGVQEHRFINFKLPFGIEQDNTNPSRSWSFDGKDGELLFTNGLNLLLKYSILEISVDKK